jgi:hypothetical protein
MTFSRIFVVICLCAAGLRAAPIKHEFVAIDEGLNHLLYVNENDAAKNWIVPIKAQARDMQLIGGNRILIGHNSGYSEIDLASGKVLKDLSNLNGVASVRRLPNGDTLVVGVNLGGSTGVVILELDAKDAVKNKTVCPGDYVRLLRQTTKDTYLMVCDTTVREIDFSGATKWETKLDGFGHAWKAVRLPNGNTLASAGYGGFLVELDPALKIVRKIGGKESVPAAVNASFYATFQLLPNGDVVVANWQGHGPGHGASGVQLVEYDKTGALVWQWSKADIISSLQGILVLDGLNTSLLHDERNGIMEPLVEGKN